MAEITTTQSFADGDTVTAAKLNNIIANASVGAEIITNRSELTSVDASNDFVLGYDASATGLRKIKPTNIVPDSSITTAKLNDSSVTTAKINDAGVTTAKIADSAITTAKIAAGAVITADLADSSVTTAKINDGSVTVAKLSNPQYTGFRNRIINGDMRIAQRGTSFASSGYTIDRFYLGGSQTNLTLTQSSSSSATGFQNYIKVGRSTGTNTGTVNLAQAIESKNSADLAGNQITFSFYAKSGANFSSTSNQITIWVFSGTGDDQPASSAGAWTGNNTFISQNQQITSSWNRYSFTGTVPSGATQIGIQIYFTPVGTAGADDTFYITGVQLEAGSTATDFERRPYGTELALCQRYYQARNSGAYDCGCTGQAYSTSAVYGPISLLMEMRSAPTITLAQVGNGAGQISFMNSSLSHPSTIGSIGVISISVNGFEIQGTGYTSGFTAGNASLLYRNGSGVVWRASAEL